MSANVYKNAKIIIFSMPKLKFHNGAKWAVMVGENKHIKMVKKIFISFEFLKILLVFRVQKCCKSVRPVGFTVSRTYFLDLNCFNCKILFGLFQNGTVR